MRIFYAHDRWTEEPEGFDVLVMAYDDGTLTVALRPGELRRGISWGPPTELTDVTGEQ